MRRKLFIALTLLVAVAMQAQTNSVAIPLQGTEAFYDFNGDGKKQAVITTDNRSVEVTNSFTEEFSIFDTLFTSTTYIQDIVYIEDVNQDGQPDLTLIGDGSEHQLLLSNNGHYTMVDKAFAVTNMDINRDGRMDYFILRSEGPEGAAYGEIAYQTTNGAFRLEEMVFVETSDASAPRRVKGRNRILKAPTSAIDLNNDGLMDLLDERDGVLYLNRGNGQWEWKEIGAAIIPEDLNGDGYMDFIVTSDALYSAIYNPTTQDYTMTVINNAGMVDDMVYCLDFDGDGDRDLLVTFSAFYNNGISYTAFFMNDGNGNFTKKNEQNYGTNNELWFSTCQDIDGDGYYDLLAFKGTIHTYAHSTGIAGEIGETFYGGTWDAVPDLVWLKGNANNLFSAPQTISSPVSESYGLSTFSMNDEVPAHYPRNNMIHHISAEDIEGNGTMRVWAPGIRTNGTTELIPILAVATNNAPTAPATPQLTYNNGLLTVTWGNGADDKTATTDLTYALRIGTTAGGNDILAAHANADGTRRNFLDGNMGRAHSYTIDLRTYAPGMVYVAVQSIDAQHMGSAWSQEATVAHTYVPVDFSLSKDKIAFGDTVEVHYSALPDGYTHTWRYADGEILSDSVYLTLTFPTGGKKTITHIVTAPNGAQDSVSHILTVLPASVGASVKIPQNASNIISHDLADYTGDGRMDGVLEAVYEGVADSTLFQKAIGLWNAYAITHYNYYSSRSVAWYDYNSDGAVDLLLRTSASNYGYMLHDPAQPTLTAMVNTDFTDNNKVLYLVGYYSSSSSINLRTLGEDMRHIGSLECFYATSSKSGQTTQIADFAPDGSFALKEMTIQGDASVLHSKMFDGSDYLFTADFDHDGFADIATIGSSANELILYYNRGDGVYEQGNIPLPETLTQNYNYSYFKLADFNGDGYIDMAVFRGQYHYYDDKFGRIYWNNGNQSFTRQDLPNAENVYLVDANSIILTDIDNNGYTDIITKIDLPSSGAGAQALYAWYMGAEGLLYHGAILEGNNLPDTYKDIYLTPDDHRLVVGDLDQLFYPILTQTDARPAAPTNIQSTMTDDGLLLTWDDAVDDHTPAALMRYNLSMKLQGSDTYLFSPQNGGNENAAYLPGYNYINATRFLIPTSVLSNGNYEIRLQAVDNQNKMSLFSETLIKAVERNPIEAPSKACAWDNTTISYQGTETGTPVWDFGTDAAIVSGSGFGPYSISWQSGGEKTITLTLGDSTYTATVTVSDPYELPIYPPQELYENVSATVSLPVGVTCEWYAKINDDTEWHSVTASGVYYLAGQFISYDRRLKAEGATITAYTVDGKTSLCDETVYLRFLFNTPEGCTGYYDYTVTVRPQTNIPTLSLVTTNAEGHNVISWTNVDAFTTINVYKEGNSLNDFQLIGSAAASAGTFTDANSDATQRAERYYVTGLSAQGESPASTIHQTVHLTINRGVTDGTYNLIWNNYSGATVTGYNILRGATPTSLSQIATLASSNTSYTDQAPEDAQPYYAIEYVLSSASVAPAKVKANTKAASLSGRSNVVNRQEIDNPAKYYTIRFLNWNNAVLQSSQVKEGAMPSYTGATPTRPEDAQYTYTFSSWSPTIVAATADADYTAQYTATPIETPDHITVRLYPTNAWTNVYLYAWLDVTPLVQPLGDWPGTPVSKDTDGWWSYTFDSSIQKVNIIWNSGEGEQTIDIMGITASTCYRLAGTDAVGKSTVEIIDCSTPVTEGIEDVLAPEAATKVLIDNQIYILRGEKIYTIQGQEVK